MKLYNFQMSFFPHTHVFLLDAFFSFFPLFFRFFLYFSDFPSIIIVFFLFYFIFSFHFIFTPFLASSQIVPTSFKNQAKIIMLTFYSTEAKKNRKKANKNPCCQGKKDRNINKTRKTCEENCWMFVNDTVSVMGVIYGCCSLYTALLWNEWMHDLFFGY